MFQPTQDVAYVQLIQELDGQQIQNGFNVYRGQGWTESSLTDAGGVIGQWFKQELLPTLSGDLVLTRIIATDMSQQVSAQVELPGGVDNQGGLLVDSLPNNVAMCVSLNSAYRGRSANGRSYLAGIPETASNGSRLTPSIADVWLAAYNILQSNYLAGIGTWVVVSRYTGGALRPTATFLPIVSCVLKDYVVDSQRRRLPGRGT